MKKRPSALALDRRRSPLVPLTLVALAIAALGLAVREARADGFNDRARVISSRAVVERIPVAREECWNDRVRGYENRSVTRSDTGDAIGPGTILGAVVGGVIGHQMGSSSGGRDRGTAAGAIVGGLVGHQIEKDANSAPAEDVESVPVERNVQRCRTVNEVREATVGYDVRYEYHGRQFVARMPHPPGRMIEVSVDVQPLVDEPPPPRPYR